MREHPQELGVLLVFQASSPGDLTEPPHLVPQKGNRGSEMPSDPKNDPCSCPQGWLHGPGPAQPHTAPGSQGPALGVECSCCHPESLWRRGSPWRDRCLPCKRAGEHVSVCVCLLVCLAEGGGCPLRLGSDQPTLQAQPGSRAGCQGFASVTGVTLPVSALFTLCPL